MIRLFYFLSALVIGLLLLTLVSAAQVLSVGNQMVVEYNALDGAIRISNNLDFASVRVTFIDTPGQYVTVSELRAWVKARPSLKGSQ